jgi:hypothetical protein
VFSVRHLLRIKKHGRVFKRLATAKLRAAGTPTVAECRRDSDKVATANGRKLWDYASHD